MTRVPSSVSKQLNSQCHASCCLPVVWLHPTGEASGGMEVGAIVGVACGGAVALTLILTGTQ